VGDLTCSEGNCDQITTTWLAIGDNWVRNQLLEVESSAAYNVANSQTSFGELFLMRHNVPGEPHEFCESRTPAGWLCALP